MKADTHCYPKKASDCQMLLAMMRPVAVLIGCCEHAVKERRRAVVGGYGLPYPTRAQSRSVHPCCPAAPAAFPAAAGRPFWAWGTLPPVQNSLQPPRSSQAAGHAPVSSVDISYDWAAWVGGHDNLLTSFASPKSIHYMWTLVRRTCWTAAVLVLPLFVLKRPVGCC